MADPTDPSDADRLVALVDEGRYEDVDAELDRLRDAETGARKATLQELRTLAADRAPAVAPLVDELTPFLDDDERPVRLTAAKLFVELARSEPGECASAVPALADRLADETEFYYVRGRCAEALGYVALDRPDEVAAPEVLADLRVGLSFDEPEVKRKLAKALECVAVGDPGRLRHRASDLADHLDDGDAVVRYHLTTALVAVGCDHPGALADASDAIEARLNDENAYVRGRAAAAVGLLARAEGAGDVPTDVSAALADADDPFVAERARYALAAVEERAGDDGAVDRRDGEATTGEIASLEAIRARSDEIVDEITAPDAESRCPHCGFAFSGDGPSTCPKCGAPRQLF